MRASPFQGWSVPRLVEGYYLATPLFVLVDVYLSAPIRVAALGDSGLRWPYYAAVFGCGAVCHWKPSWAPGVGMFESSLNLLLLTIAILSPIWGALERIETGAPLQGPFDEVSLLNFVLSGSVFIAAFYGSQRAARGGP